MPCRILAIAAGIAAASVAATAQTVILSEDFSSGASGWYSSTETAPTWNESTQDLTQEMPNSSHLLRNFTPTTIQVGEIMQVSYNITFTGVGSTASFRNIYGLLNSGRDSADWVSANGLGVDSASLFSGYQGYTVHHFANLADQSTSNAIRMFQRRADSSILLGVNTTNDVYSEQQQDTGTAGSTYFRLESGITYTNVISLERAVDESDNDILIFTYSMLGDGVPADHTRTGTMTNPPGGFVFTFDTVAIGAPTTAIAESYNIDNVMISVIPEPSTYGIFGGIAALAMVMILRRRRK